MGYASRIGSLPLTDPWKRQNQFNLFSAADKHSRTLVTEGHPPPGLFEPDLHFPFHMLFIQKFMLLYWPHVSFLFCFQITMTGNKAYFRECYGTR